MTGPREVRVARADIPARERLIFAMDVPAADDARRLADRLGDSVAFYKLGLELFMSGGAFELLDWMVGRGNKVFLDLKLFDVPATVAGAVRNLRNRGVTFATVHGNQAIMEAAAGAADGVGILAVTVLTSLDRGDLDDLGFKCDVEALVLSRARRALAAGCVGVVSSGLEAKMLRAGVDADHVNNLGWTGLLEAVILGDGGARHQAIVKRLIEAGADVNLADGKGVTPLRHARERGQAEVARLLEAAGAKG